MNQSYLLPYLLNYKSFLCVFVDLHFGWFGIDRAEPLHII